MQQNSPLTVIDNYTLASPVQRVLAFAVDYIISLALVSLPNRYHLPLPLIYIAGFISIFYLLTRDGIFFVGYRSIGKRIFGLRVIQHHRIRINIFSALKRNVFFLPNIFLLINYDYFHYIVLLLNGAAILVEVYLLFASSETLRAGDYLADTRVIENED